MVHGVLAALCHLNVVFLLYSSSVALFLSHHVEITTNKTVYINPHCLEMDVSI